MARGAPFGAVFSVCLLGALSLPPADAGAPGILVGSPVVLDTPDMSWVYPAAGNGNGPFVLPWITADSSPTRLRARVFDSSGQPRTAALDLATIPAGDRLGTVASAMDDLGGFLVAWHVYSFGSPPGAGRIEARRFNPDGSSATPTLVLADPAAYGALAMTFRPDGSFIVAWSEGDLVSRRLVVRLFGAEGNPVSPPIPVSASLEFPNVFVDSNGQGGFVLAYTLNNPFLYDAWARVFGPDAAPRSPEIHVSPVPTSQNTYYVAGTQLLPDGRFVVAYQRSDPFIQPIPAFEVTLATFDGAGNHLTSATVAPAGAHTQGAFLAADRSHNLATLTDYYSPIAPINPWAARFRLANAGGNEVGVATVPKPQFSNDPGNENATGLVASGLGAFNLVWVLAQSPRQAYLQSLILPPEIGPPSSFFTVPACRLVDTRVSAAPMSAGEDRVFAAAGHCAIPPTAKTIAVNAVAVASSAVGNLRFYPPDRPAPGTAALTYPPGGTRGSFALIALDESARFAARAVQASGTVHLVIDVMGYFE